MNPRKRRNSYLFAGAGILLVLYFALQSHFQEEPRVLRIAMWQNYIDLATKEEFEKETGTRVVLDVIGNNEELIDKIRAGVGNYDLITPSDYAISVLSHEGLLQALNLAKDFAERFNPRYLRRSFDPQNQYSMPLAWGLTGIAVRTDLYKKPIKGWHDFFNDPALAGKISVLNDERELLGAALLMSGRSLNTDKLADIENAAEFLRKKRKDFRALVETPALLLTEGSVVAAQWYSNDMRDLKNRNHLDLQFVVPSEGASFWVDNVAIPKYAENTRDAYRWMNFIFDSTHGPTYSKRKAFSSTLKGLDEPSGSDHFEEIIDVGDKTKFWDRAWKKVQLYSEGKSYDK